MDPNWIEFARRYRAMDTAHQAAERARLSPEQLSALEGALAQLSAQQGRSVKLWLVLIGGLLLLGLIGSLVQDRPATRQAAVGQVASPEPARQATRAVDNLQLQPGWTFEVGEYGFGHVTGYVQNNTSHKYTYVQITFNLYDAAGAQVGSAMANVNNLEAGGKWRFKAAVLEGKDAATARLGGISGF